MPFCDGEHFATHFDGLETASKDPYLKQAEIFEGPTITLRM